jgi:flagellar basal-body rod modification protein FlgD
MIVDALGSSQQASTQTASAVSNTTSVAKDQFLKLLVAQIQNQDPMKPMDNQEFVAQLATFSSLEQLMSINEGVTKLADASSTETSAINTM